VISGPLYLSVFAAIAHSHENQAEVRALVSRGLRGTVTVLAPAFCGLAFTAHLVVPLLLGPKWLPTGAILALLAPAGFFICMYAVANAMLLGLGRSDQQFRLTLLNGAMTSLSALIGSHFGSEGVAAGLSLGAAVAAPGYIIVLSREVGISPFALIQDIAPPLAATGAMVIVLASLSPAISEWGASTQVIMMMAAGAISFTAVLAATAWQSFAEDVRWLCSAGRRSEAGRLSI
jgi:O-antigen/teichoic acid export membrane protein